MTISSPVLQNGGMILDVPGVGLPVGPARVCRDKHKGRLCSRVCLAYVAAGAESCSENRPLLGVGLRGWVRTVIVRHLHIESKVSGT